MNQISNSRISIANYGLTDSQNQRNCAHIPRSSNGKTTDSDSETARPISAKLRNSDPVCSPCNCVDNSGYCELCAPAILSELARVKALFQLRAVVACIGGGLWR